VLDIVAKRYMIMKAGALFYQKKNEKKRKCEDAKRYANIKTPYESIAREESEH
jgi:hypothetical protein